MPPQWNLGLGQAASAASIPVVLASDQTPLSVASTPSSGALTDRSAAITLGGTQQLVAAANPNRKYLFFENVSDTDMWINFTANAVAGQPSILIKANGGNFIMENNFISTEAISVICATTGKQFACKEA